ncbi:hypothetical protein [Dactylosporangium sp. CA-233914]|uniref:hypothetical protein n=1 Tax=Dactylosporangium sp. CA-233914 TaxID=3239934 RepID=UPI003D914F22
MFGLSKRREKKDRLGDFLFKIFGPATVEGAMQGWSPQAQAQYKQMCANQKRAAEEARRAQEQEAA